MYTYKCIKHIRAKYFIIRITYWIIRRYYNIFLGENGLTIIRIRFFFLFIQINIYIFIVLFIYSLVCIV